MNALARYAQKIVLVFLAQSQTKDVMVIVIKNATTRNRTKKAFKLNCGYMSVLNKSHRTEAHKAT